MSGHKRATITIDQDEYQRLHAIDDKFRMVQNKSHIDGKILEHYQNSLHDVQAQISTREEQYQVCLNQLTNQMRCVEDRIAQDLAVYRNSFYDHANDLTANLWSQIDRILIDQQQMFSDQITGLQQQLDEQFNQLDQSVQAIQSQNSRKVVLSRSWIDAARSIAIFIEHQYNYRKFAPGRLEEIWTELSMADENLNADAPETALAMAQNAYRHSSRLRLELEYAENEWQLVYLATCEMIDQIFGIVEDNWSIPIMDPDENLSIEPLSGPNKQTILVDEWCSGGLSQEIHRLEAIQSQLFYNHPEMDLDDLNHIRSNLLPDIEEQIHQCRFEARLKAVSSQIRINIADIALTELERQGFVIVSDETGYDSGDQRSTFTATTRNEMGGGEVVIKVVPSLDEPGKNDLHIHTFDTKRISKGELFLRAHTIRKSLQRRGLDIGEMRMEKDYLFNYCTEEFKKQAGLRNRL